MHRTTGFWTILAALLFSLGAAIGVNAFTGQTTRVSVSSAGVPASAGAASGVLSGDGRYVVFQSSSTNLVDGVSGLQVYRHDRVTGVTALVSITRGGAGSAFGSRFPSVSANGRYVVFSSFASDLADGDTNGTLSDVYVRDMVANTTRLVSASAAGVVGDQSSALSGLAGAHEISDDGRYVVFTSLATNLLTEPYTGGQQQVYVKDTGTGAVARVSLNEATSATAGDGSSGWPAISGNGRFVAFGSMATNLTTPSASGTFHQVFVRDLVDGTTTLEAPGTRAISQPFLPAPTLSSDGRYLAFVAEVPLDTHDLDNGTADVYLRDRTAGTTVLASLSPNTVPGASSVSPSISADGRWVAFESPDELIAGTDTNFKVADVFLYDRDSQTVKIVSLNDAGEQTTLASSSASLSADGHLVMFATLAANVVPNPASTGPQLYVRALVSNQAPAIPAFGKDITRFENERLNLTWDFSDNDSSAWTATVDYGDGAGKEPLTLNANKTYSLSHLWAPGEYFMTVEITDDAGATGSRVLHVVVSNTAPSVGLLSTMNLAFTRTLDTYGTFTDPGSNETYSATVNYGDGTPTQALAIGPYSAPPLAAGSFTLRHNYANAGTYNVTVTVSDGRPGGSTTGTMVVNVSGYGYEWSSSFVVGRNLPVKFTVSGPDGAFILDQSVRVDVVDAAGNVVAGPYLYGDQPSRSVMATSDSYHVNVDTRDLAPGAYWLRVRFSSPALTGEFTLGSTGASRTRARLR